MGVCVTSHAPGWRQTPLSVPRSLAHIRSGLLLFFAQYCYIVIKGPGGVRNTRHCGVLPSHWSECPTNIHCIYPGHFQVRNTGKCYMIISFTIVHSSRLSRPTSPLLVLASLLPPLLSSLAATAILCPSTGPVVEVGKLRNI